MKIIALVPFKNEEWILPTYLSNVLPVVDEVIAIDDGSTDNSRKIMEDAGVKVVGYEINRDLENLKAGWYEWTMRQELLRLGREADGTHFVILDADETFTTNFLPHARELIASLKPGQKLAMQWLALWKSYTHYRHDHTVWSNNWKDFIVADDETSDYPYTFGGCQRTHGCNERHTWASLNREHGAVLHYQFSQWNNFQLKQCNYRMHEFIHAGHSASQTNGKHSITLLDDNVGLQKMPESWTTGVPVPNYPNFDSSWSEESYVRKDMLPESMKHFDDYGVEHFEELDIWHVPQLRERFIKDTGREPK